MVTSGTEIPGGTAPESGSPLPLNAAEQTEATQKLDAEDQPDATAPNQPTYTDIPRLGGPVTDGGLMAAAVEAAKASVGGVVLTTPEGDPAKQIAPPPGAAEDWSFLSKEATDKRLADGNPLPGEVPVAETPAPTLPDTDYSNLSEPATNERAANGTSYPGEVPAVIEAAPQVPPPDSDYWSKAATDARIADGTAHPDEIVVTPGAQQLIDAMAEDDAKRQARVA